jgi:hypothetical protein
MARWEGAEIPVEKHVQEREIGVCLIGVPGIDPVAISTRWVV